MEARFAEISNAKRLLALSGHVIWQCYPAMLSDSTGSA
jgi:hypothetical protein